MKKSLQTVQHAKICPGFRCRLPLVSQDPHARRSRFRECGGFPTANSPSETGSSDSPPTGTGRPSRNMPAGREVPGDCTFSANLRYRVGSTVSFRLYKHDSSASWIQNWTGIDGGRVSRPDPRKERPKTVRTVYLGRRCWSVQLLFPSEIKELLQTDLSDS